MGGGDSTSGVRIIRAGAADVARLAPLFRAYLRFYGRTPGLSAPEEFLRARLRSMDSLIFLAEIGGRAIGFAQLYPSFDSIELDKILILHDLFVEPDARRRGVARGLMEAVRQYGETVGACGIGLATAIDNDGAQALYEQLGYVRDERFLHYFLTLSDGARDAR
ncbi:MAG: hypothetical protein AMJ59_18645 [Gammaproteobacteria bacterium SG8_31]|nr:MAG: hypothetical protein AMJ59_18645 [Gammaproteobacteria bacterium SG8_31]